MRRIDNRGSVTIEISIIMPVIFLIIVMLIKLYTGLIYEGNVCGNSYSSLYLYEISTDDNSGAASGEKLNALNSQLKDISDSVLMYESDRCNLSAALSEGNVSIYSASSSESVTYKTEYDKCSSRLRRWQLYGDVVH